jgi:hypothetical protein
MTCHSVKLKNNLNDNIGFNSNLNIDFKYIFILLVVSLLSNHYTTDSVWTHNQLKQQNINACNNFIMVETCAMN